MVTSVNALVSSIGYWVIISGKVACHSMVAYGVLVAADRAFDVLEEKTSSSQKSGADKRCSKCGRK